MGLLAPAICCCKIMRCPLSCCVRCHCSNISVLCRSGPVDRDPNAYRVLVAPFTLSAMIAAITSCIIVFVENSGRSLSVTVQLMKRSIWSMIHGSAVLYIAMMCVGLGFPQHIILSWLACIVLSSFAVVPLTMTSRSPTWYVHDLLSSSPQLCCLGGAWLGAISITLDWNVPWQRWPIPVALGGLVGHLFGCLWIWVIEFFH